WSSDVCSSDLGCHDCRVVFVAVTGVHINGGGTANYGIGSIKVMHGVAQVGDDVKACLGVWFGISNNHDVAQGIVSGGSHRVGARYAVNVFGGLNNIAGCLFIRNDVD